MEFQGKNIVIISQQDWGKMFVSKHHYATELAKKGNVVYFFNSPAKDDSLKPGEIVIEQTEIAGLYVVKHRFPFSYNLKFRFKWLFGILVKKHIQRILVQIKQIDIVWSFDLSNTLPLGAFPANAYKIYMLADMPGKESLIAAKDADIILSTNFKEDFLEEYFTNTSVRKKFVNHGVAEAFIEKKISVTVNTHVQVGLSGNFTTHFIDWDTLLSIIRQHLGVTFNFFGAVNVDESNLGGNKSCSIDAISKLKSMPNVILHGVISSRQLSEGLNKMDLFLICYDVYKEQSNGTNYHKLLEYLSKGKVIVSNNVLAYVDTNDLVEMPFERHNENLPNLFTNVLNNIDYHNSFEKQTARVAYASGHTYAKNVEKISSLIDAS